MSWNLYNLKQYNVISFHPQFPDVLLHWTKLLSTPRSVGVDSYYPDSVYEVRNGIDHKHSKYHLMLLLDVRRRNPHALWRARPGVPHGGIFWRDAGNIYYLQGYTGDTAKYAYVQQVVVSSIIVHRSCLSRGLERVIRVEMCGQCRIYARRQGTTFWFILQYVPLFNYNTLTNISNPVDIIPSPNPNIPLSSAIPAAELALSGTYNNFPQSHPTSSSPLVHSPSYLGT